MILINEDPGAKTFWWMRGSFIDNIEKHTRLLDVFRTNPVYYFYLPEKVCIYKEHGDHKSFRWWVIWTIGKLLTPHTSSGDLLESFPVSIPCMTADCMGHLLVWMESMIDHCLKEVIPVISAVFRCSPDNVITRSILLNALLKSTPLVIDQKVRQNYVRHIIPGFFFKNCVNFCFKSPISVRKSMHCL